MLLGLSSTAPSSKYLQPARKKLHTMAMCSSYWTGRPSFGYWRRVTVVASCSCGNFPPAHEGLPLMKYRSFIVDCSSALTNHTHAFQLLRLSRHTDQPWWHSHGRVGDLRHDAVRPSGDLHDLHGAGRVDGIPAAHRRVAGDAFHTPEREGNVSATGVWRRVRVFWGRELARGCVHVRTSWVQNIARHGANVSAQQL